MNRAKHNRIVWIATGILLFLFLVVACHSCGPELAVSDYENKVNQIKEIDASKRQEELNMLVDEGKMNVNYSSKAIFHGRISEHFNIKNIKNNHHAIEFQLYDETGECIYSSKKLAPGYEMTSIELEKELTKGVHQGKLKVGYAEEGNVSSAFPITIEVR